MRLISRDGPCHSSVIFFKTLRHRLTTTIIIVRHSWLAVTVSDQQYGLEKFRDKLNKFVAIMSVS